MNGRRLASAIGAAMIQAKRTYIDGYLSSQFGLREVDFIRGRTETGHGEPIVIDPAIRQRYDRILDGSDPAMGDMLRNQFVILTKDAESVRLWSVWPGAANPLPMPFPYTCIGSGGDAGDAVLRDFVVNRTRGARADIDPVEGVATMLYATHRAGETNVGVGGTPHIAIISNGEAPIIPSEQNSRLAMEAVRGGKA